MLDVENHTGEIPVVNKGTTGRVRETTISQNSTPSVKKFQKTNQWNAGNHLLTRRTGTLRPKQFLPQPSVRAHYSNDFIVWRQSPRSRLASVSSH